MAKDNEQLSTDPVYEHLRAPVREVVERVTDPYRCGYADCPEVHPLARDGEDVTCPTCVEAVS